MAAIRLEGVTKAFPDGTVAVRSVDLEIEDGEFFVLVGPSGCGKSTLLNLIVGLETPTRGEVLLDGRPVTHLPPRKRNMAMVFQSYAIYPHLTVRGNLAFPLEIAGVPPDERARRVAEVAAMLELEPLLDRKPATLSGGQRQRVSMGRALVRDPVALLLDEPLSNLDARLRGQMRREIARLHRRLGTTVVYVTHDQTEALTLGDRVSILNGGEVQQVGTPRTVYRYPANRFVGAFLGAPPMNLMRGFREDGRLALPFGSLPWPAGLATNQDSLEVGVRPEDVHQAGPGEDPARTEVRFRATVELVEWLGAETWAHVEAGAGPDGGRTRLVARIEADGDVRAGHEIDLEVRAEHLHFFDASSGKRVGDRG
jgi:multiple sugar transport system ATP-binding protein